MDSIFTSLYQRLFFLTFALFTAVCGPADLYAQCSETTPVYEVDLTGKPGGSWTSPDVTRDGTCCSALKNETCVQFNITLDALSGGLQFEISSGPVPAGAMTYQIDCGPPMSVGDPICVTGSGPHELSICMPGNSKNTFTVYSIAAYEPVGDVNVTRGCSTTMEAPIAFDPATVQWNDITGGGTYNSYLSCTSGCSTTTVTPDANPPAFVDYTVCGNSTSAVCTDIPYCDTVRVYFHPPITASISPDPAIICPGSGTVDLVGSASGGSGFYDYFWFDAAGTLLANAQTYTATAAGTYTLEVRNENYPSCTPFKISTTVVENLSVNAGADQEVCANESIQLAGTVTAASGGVWSGGAGVFSPDATDLNATYTPTADEVAAGSLQLTITTTGNGSCDPVSDQVLISFLSFDLSITAPTTLCAGSTATLTANASGGLAPYSYLWSSGESTQSISTTTPGTFTVRVTDARECTFETSETISEEAGPTDLTASATASTCSEANGGLSVTSVTGGTALYTYSLDGVNFQTAETFSGLAPGTYEITVQDANGCTFTKAVELADQPGPSSFTTSLSSSFCSQANGEIEVTAVAGGTAPFTYSIDGSSFQTSATFSGLTAGSYTLWVQDANNCTFSQSGFELTDKAGPTAVSASTLPASCADNDGSIEVGTVTGGTAPYTYSIDGSSFQTATSFTGLASGSFTVTAQDANGCTVSTAVSVEKTVPTDLSANLSPSSCGEANGEITFTMATGGETPYTFSVDGTNFQASVLFSGLAAGNYTLTVKDANGCTYAENVVLTDQPGPTDLSLSNTSSTCGGANGTLSVTGVAGGTAPYSYSLDGTSFQTATTFSGLFAGTYSVTVKDANGCTYADEVTVADIAGPAEFTVATTSSTCSEANGAISVNGVTGGTSPYTYSIDGTTFQAETTFDKLLAGAYTLTVKDANGCLFAKDVSLADLPGPSDFTSTITPSTCGDPNGSVSISEVSSGTAPYAYSTDGTNFQASSTLNGLLAGTYTIVVKDANGCLFAKDLSVSDIAGPTAISASSQPASCEGSDGSIEVAGVTGGTGPYAYSLDGTTFQTSTSFAGLAYGSYTITVKDANGCTFSTGITVERVGPTDMAFSTTASNCGAKTGSFTVSSVTGGLTPYTYSIDGTTFQASETFSNLYSGLYTVWVKDANGCTYSEEVPINDVGGATDVAASLGFTSCGQSNGEIVVESVTGGTAPYTYSLDGGTFQSSTTFSNLAAATYSLSVKDANGCLFTTELVLEDMPAPSDMSISTASSTCGDANGAISMNEVNGGTGPYTYSIDGTTFQAETTFDKLLAGTYTLTVKDANGCLYSEEVVLENIPGPTAMSLSTSTSFCSEANGSLKVEDVTGGSTPYTYSIDGTNFQSSPLFRELLAGTYEVSVKDVNGCILTGTATIEDIAGPTAVNASTLPATCADNDGSIEAGTVTGGTAPFTYSIDGSSFQTATSFTGLASGSYTVTAQDANGCTVSTAVSVEKLAPTALEAVLTPSTCGNANGEISITAVTGGLAPYAYSIDGINFQTATTFSGLAAATYTLTVKDANGCTFAKQIELNDLAGPSDISPGLKAATCGHANGEITLSSVTGGTAPFTYSVDGTTFQESETFTGLAAGTYTLSVKDANGCLYTEEAVLENIDGPTELTLTAASSSCSEANGEVEVAAVAGGTAPYAYSIDGENFREEVSFGNLLAGTYAVTVKDANGCTFSKEVEVENIPGPSDVSTESTSATCGQSDGSLMVSSVSGGTAPYSFSLDGINYQTEELFTGLAAGEFMLQVKDANACVYQESVTIENTNGPAGLEATTTAATCSENNGSITLTAVSGGTAPYSYSINGTTFQSSETFSTLFAGTYPLSVKDANGCTFSKEVVVEDASGVTSITSSSTPSSCTESTGSLQIESVNGGTAPFSYSLDGTSYQEGTSFTDLAPSAYTVYVKDANGCVSSFSEEVPTNGPQDAQKSISDASCGESDGSLTVESVSGGTAPYTYSIDGTNFQTSTTFSDLPAGNYSLYIQDTSQCVLELPFAISNSGGPEAFTISATDARCSEANGAIAISEVVGGTAPFTYSIDGTNYQSSNSFTGLSAGVYYVSVQDAGGCILFKTDTIHYSEAPHALTYTTIPATCGAANGSLQLESVNGGTAPYTYSLDGQSFQEADAFTSLVAGNYTLYVKDKNGCVYSETLQLEGISGPAEVNFRSKDASCEERGHVSVENVTGGTAPYLYSLGGTSYQASTDFTGLQPGNYTLYIKDANGCILSSSVFINEPGVRLDYLQAVSCYGSGDGQIAFRTNGGENKPQFSIDGGTTYQSDSVFRNLAHGYYTVQVKYSASCTRELDSLLVSQPDSLWAKVSPTAKAIGTEASGSAVVSKVQGGTAPYTYSLNNRAFDTDSVFTQLSGGEHVLLVMDAAGCIETVLFTIELIADMEIPNGFTPNGDGINDGWALKNLSVLYPQCRVMVYNRWGVAVFKSEGYSTEWDGTNKGQTLPDATYYYVIQLKEGEAPLKGAVTIMR